MSVSALHTTLWTTFFLMSNARKPLVGWFPSLALWDDWSIKHNHASINHYLFLLPLTFHRPLHLLLFMVILSMKLFLVEAWEFPTIFWYVILKAYRRQEPTSLRRLCSTFCNLNPGNARFSGFELFKGLYINPRLLILILVCFELAKV